MKDARILALNGVECSHIFTRVIKVSVHSVLLETRASLDDLTPTATRPLHHAVSVMLINPETEWCGEDRH